MKYSSRFFLYAPMGLFLALVLGVSIHWWVVASAFSARLAAMNGHEIAPGVTMHYASRTISGFPFTLDTVFREMNFEIATPHGPTRWHADKFAMHALTYGRDETIFEAAGPQELSWTRDDGTRRTLAFAVGSLHASAIEDRTGMVRFDLDLVGFGSKALTAQRFQFHIRRNIPRDMFDIVVTANGVHFLGETRPDLGERIATASLTASIGAAEAFDPLRAGTQRWFDAVTRWRSANGTLGVEYLSLAWSEMTMNGRGTLLLDAANRPQGELEFRISGLPAFLQHAAKQNLAHGPNTGVAGSLIDRGQANVVLGFANGIVTVGGEPADTLAPLY